MSSFPDITADQIRWVDDWGLSVNGTYVTGPSDYPAVDSAVGPGASLGGFSSQAPPRFTMEADGVTPISPTDPRNLKHNYQVISNVALRRTVQEGQLLPNGGYDSPSGLSIKIGERWYWPVGERYYDHAPTNGADHTIAESGYA